jgi:hypothetical protein
LWRSFEKHHWAFRPVSGATLVATVGLPLSRLMCFGKKASAVDPAAVGPRPRSAGTTAAASVPADDRDITTQYQRLYLEDVRTWSRHFLAPPQSLPVFNPHEEQQLRTVVLINDLDAIMANDSLRRSTLEGLVGSHISRMLGQQSMFFTH